MSMTKRDIADIVLMCMAAYFLAAMLSGIAGFVLNWGLTKDAMQLIKKSYIILSQAIYVVALLFLNYVLLFKRSQVLTLILREGRDKELSFPEGLAVLTSISFWIRLYGIYTFLRSFVSFLSGLTAGSIADKQILAPSFYWYQIGPPLISAILGLLIIWKAEWIGKELTKLGQKKYEKQQP